VTTKALLLENIHPDASARLAKEGYQVDTLARALGEDELIEAIAGVNLLGIRSGTQITERVLDAAPDLVAIGAFCIGVNQIDVAAASRRGVAVFNAPFSNTRSVAELVVAEIILLLRGIPARNAAAHRGEWLKTASGSHEVRGKTLAIVGYGHIGTQVGLLAEGLGMRVIFHDIVTKLALGNARPLPSLAAVLDEADVLTLHVAETAQTFRMVGRGELARMKRGSSLINAARGTVVDVDALAEALRTGHLAGAALDVFPREPKTDGEEFVSPLRGLPNVLLTPHVGGSTEEAQESIGVEVAEKLLKYSNNGSTLSAVNFPEVALPEHPGKHRLLHIHRNQPGVLSSINHLFSERRINIAGQYLQTDARIGYVVIDVETGPREEALALKRGLEGVPGTIRTRVLY